MQNAESAEGQDFVVMRDVNQVFIGERMLQNADGPVSSWNYWRCLYKSEEGSRKQAFQS